MCSDDWKQEIEYAHDAMKSCWKLSSYNIKEAIRE